MKLQYYYVRRGEELFGPAKPNQLIEAASRGVIHPTDEISLDRDGPWHLALTCVEFGFDDGSSSYIVWEGIERHGPYSLLRLYEMLEYGEARWETNVADVDGRMTKLGLLLQLPAPKEGTLSENQQLSDQVPTFVEIVPPSALKPSPPNDRPQRQPLKEEEPPLEEVSDLQTLEALLKEERIAESTKSLSSTEKKLPPRRHRTRPRRKQRKTEASPPKKRSQSSSSLSQKLTFSPSLRKTARTPEFEQSYKLVAFAITLLTSSYLFVTSLLISRYVVRIFFLAIEVFVPFESSAESLQESDLVLAGITLVCLVGELLLPLFFLIKADADFRLWAVVTLFGALLCQAFDTTQLAGLTNLARLICVASGILITGGGLWMAYLVRDQQWLTFGILTSLTSLSLALWLAMLSLSDVLTVKVDQVPPALTGNVVPIVLTALCLLGILLPVPLYALRMISTQTDRSTQAYLNAYWWGFLGGSIVCLMCVGFLSGTIGPRFLSLPIALFPLASGTVLAGLLQSQLWLLQPARSLR
ncbi:MAG: hypothetical protein HUJ26_09275 [Planctomycetaceae bacterium]|nr:hypothetical protein [Planctomycetaceae bacterium]